MFVVPVLAKNYRHNLYNHWLLVGSKPGQIPQN